MVDRFEVTDDALQALRTCLADQADAAGKGVRVFFSGFG